MTLKKYFTMYKIALKSNKPQSIIIQNGRKTSKLVTGKQKRKRWLKQTQKQLADLAYLFEPGGKHACRYFWVFQVSIQLVAWQEINISVSGIVTQS